MKTNLVVGNWKMNGNLANNQALFSALSSGVPGGVDCVVCVPFPYLAQAAEQLAASVVKVGAQNVSEYSEGAYTGEVSASMLAEFSCGYVIVGHSERRNLFGESSETVARKAALVLHAGMTPIVCVGETLAERETDAVEAVLERQLDALDATLDAAMLARIVIAYEPVWAIGTGRSAAPAQIQAVLAFIRGWLSQRLHDANVVRVLYGGSVKGATALDLFALPDADGGLIGGASLVADEYLTICKAALCAS